MPIRDPYPLGFSVDNGGNIIDPNQPAVNATYSSVGEPSKAPPERLHRVNGHAAVLAMMYCASKVRDGEWVQGAPSHVFTEFMTELAERGFYLGTGDHDADLAEESP
jgi:hypothetical protein